MLLKGGEKSKFIFTKSLSDVLSLVESIGQRYDLSVSELSNIRIEELQNSLNSMISVDRVSQILKNQSEEQRLQRRLSHACQLPPLLTECSDFETFILSEEKPNLYR